MLNDSVEIWTKSYTGSTSGSIAENCIDICKKGTHLLRHLDFRLD